MNRPNVDGKLNGRIDVTRDTRLDLESRFLHRHRQSRQPEHPGRPRQAADLHRPRRHRRPRPALQPLRHLGQGRRRAHRLPGLALHRRLDCEQRGPQLQPLQQPSCAAATSSRPASSRSSRSAPTAACTISRSISSACSAIPSAGYVKGGSTFEFTRIITGEMAVGWITRRYEDPTLPNICRADGRRLAHLGRERAHHREAHRRHARR